MAQKDWEIICTVLNGDADKYSLLISKYKDDISKIVSAHVPPQCVFEVAHETFIRGYQSLRTYSPDKPFKRWLSVIAVRCCADHWRAEYKKKEVPISTLSDDTVAWLEKVQAAGSENEYETLSQEKEAREMLNGLLERLSPLDRMVLVLTQLEEYSGKEAAEMLGISLANVKVRAFRAKRALKKLLIECGVER